MARMQIEQRKSIWCSICKSEVIYYQKKILYTKLGRFFDEFNSFHLIFWWGFAMVNIIIMTCQVQIWDNESYQPDKILIFLYSRKLIMF